MIKVYLKNLSVILKHKWYYMIAARWVGASWLSMITHDLSKLLPSEFFPYAEKFYSGDYAYKFNEVEKAFGYAWNYHQKRNKHHPEYWISYDKAILMPDRYVKEMVADWLAAGKAYEGKYPDVYNWKWLDNNKEELKKKLHPLSWEKVLVIIRDLKWKHRTYTPV